MLELYIIRHGLAGQCLEDKMMDEERPLKKKGKEQLKEIAKGLEKHNICFDIVLTSPLLRAKQSAEIINSHCGKNKGVTETNHLKPGASYINLIKFLNKLKNKNKVAIVGHEPFLSGFASYCLSKSKTSFINLKKGGIIKLETDKMIKPGHCIMSWLTEPTHLT